MATNRNLEPSDTLKDVFRLAENVKIAYELVEEKSPSENKKLNYLLKNLSHEIDSLLTALDSAIETTSDSSNYEEVDFEIISDEDNAMSEEEKVM